MQGGVEAGANLEGPLCPEQPCVSGLFLMTSSWVGSPTTAPGTAQSRCLQLGDQESVSSLNSEKESGMGSGDLRKMLLWLRSFCKIHRQGTWQRRKSGLS